jgi:hypothetical protein
LADISLLVSEEGVSSESVDLVIRALDRASEFASENDLLLALAREHGLFPYIVDDDGQPTTESLPFRDAVAMEMHRPDGLEHVVFHTVQAQVYERLLNRENVILSAPTSFGKSLIIDALIATGNYTNVVIIVPTIALLDEARRRLSRFRNYKVITHPGQDTAAKNIFVLTQERYLAIETMPRVDLFFIDEFYKLQDTNPDASLNGRSSLLNQALRKLLNTGAQFYLAGPNIRGLDESLPPNLQAAFIRTDYSTVAADTVMLEATNDDQRRSELLRVLRGTSEPTIIFCRSPKRAREVMGWLLADNRTAPFGPGMRLAADWISHNYSAQWSFRTALMKGIGVHHGRLPRWLAQLVVDGFNQGDLGVLICTNSLIEGVNTRAKNIIILDKKIANTAYDYFTFANIRGRAGRMLKHFVGKIYLFHKEPENMLPEVDMPGISQSDAAPDSLLLAIAESERTAATQERLREITEQRDISQEVLRLNRGVDPTSQIDLAKYLTSLPRGELAVFQWDAPYPQYSQLKAVIRLIWDFVPPDNIRSHGALSADQLTLLVWRVSHTEGNTKSLLEVFTDNPDSWSGTSTVDDRIEAAFDFLRFWIDHTLPNLLRVVDRIAKEVLEARGLSTGSFVSYAARVEAGFLPPMLATVEEFGIPTEITQKLVKSFPRYDSLDELVSLLKDVSPSAMTQLTSFEVDLVERAIKSL